MYEMPSVCVATAKRMKAEQEINCFCKALNDTNLGDGTTLEEKSYEKGGGGYKKTEKFTPFFLHVTTNRL